MGLLQYEYDNETRIIHFCKHRVIKDREPEDYDTVSGSWFVKEPRERGREISASRITWTPPSPEIPRLVLIYFNHQLRAGGAWEGWKICDVHWKDVKSCFDVMITKVNDER